MRYAITYARQALRDLKDLPKKDRLLVQALIEKHLVYQPSTETAARIRKLRADVFPPYRLRVDPYRVVYDVDEAAREVVIHGIGEKPEIYARLAAEGDGDDE